MISKKRAQAAAEVLSYAAFFLLIFVASVAVFFQMQSQELSRAENAYAQEIAYGFSDHIRTAFIAGDGFSQRFDIAPDILGKPYKIWLSRGTNPNLKETGIVYVEWKGSSGETSLSSPTVTAGYHETTSGVFITTSGEFIVIDSTKGRTIVMKNDGGEIRISGVAWS